MPPPLIRSSSKREFRLKFEIRSQVCYPPPPLRASLLPGERLKPEKDLPAEFPDKPMIELVLQSNVWYQVSGASSTRFDVPSSRARWHAAALPNESFLPGLQAYVFKESANEVKVRFPSEWSDSTFALPGKAKARTSFHRTPYGGDGSGGKRG